MNIAEITWDRLATPTDDGHPQRFDRASLDPLPAAGRRWLRRAIPDGSPLLGCVEVDMDGEIKLGPRWFPFTAREILRGGIGFAWRPIVGGRLLRFVGADLLGPDGARTEFRLHGVIPIVTGSGPDVTRSAAGRLAAETVAWLPQACTPQMGARWHAGDDDHDDRAVVTLDAAGETVDVEISVDADGRLTETGLQRWNDSLRPPAPAPFGGRTTREHVTASDVRVSGAGAVGWGSRRADHAGGEFFRYRLTSVRFIR